MHETIVVARPPNWICNTRAGALWEAETPSAGKGADYFQGMAATKALLLSSKQITCGKVPI
jgi:hypothetical protein